MGELMCVLVCTHLSCCVPYLRFDYFAINLQCEDAHVHTWGVHIEDMLVVCWHNHSHHTLQKHIPIVILVSSENLLCTIRASRQDLPGGGVMESMTPL